MLLHVVCCMSSLRIASSPGDRCSILRWIKFDFLLGQGLFPFFKTHHTVSGYRGSFPRVKLPVHEVDHPPSSSAEVKDEWSYTSSPPVCLHDVDRKGFTV